MDQNDQLIDLVGKFLNVFGKYSFDIPGRDSAEITDLCQAWADHLMLGHPHPDTSKRESLEKGKKDVYGAVAFLEEVRKEEEFLVSHVLKDQRQVFYSFIRNISDAVAKDSADNQTIYFALSNLKEAAKSDDLEALRRQSTEVASLVTKSLEEREKRDKEKFSELTGKLEKVKEDLGKHAGATDDSVDHLTQLTSRKAFDKFYHGIFQGEFPEKRQFMVMVTINNLDDIKEKYDPDNRDKVVTEIARNLSYSFKNKEDVLARYESDKLVVFVPTTTTNDTLSLVDKFINKSAELSFDFAPNEALVNLSVGITPRTQDDVEKSWIQRSDKAAFMAKEEGKNIYKLLD